MKVISPLIGGVKSVHDRCQPLLNRLDRFSVVLFYVLLAFLVQDLYGAGIQSITLPITFMCMTVVFAWITWLSGEYHHRYMLWALIGGVIIEKAPYKEVIQHLFYLSGHPLGNPNSAFVFLLVFTCVVALIVQWRTKRTNAMRRFGTIMICGVCVSFTFFHYIVIQRAVNDEIMLKNERIKTIIERENVADSFRTHCDLEGYECVIGDYEKVGQADLIKNDPQASGIHEFSASHNQLLHTWPHVSREDNFTMNSYLKLDDMAVMIRDESNYANRVRYFTKSYLWLSTLFFVVWSSALFYLIPKHTRPNRKAKKKDKITKKD